MLSPFILQGAKIPALVATIALGAMGLPMLAAGLSHGDLDCGPSAAPVTNATPGADLASRNASSAAPIPPASTSAVLPFGLDAGVAVPLGSNGFASRFGLDVDNDGVAPGSLDSPGSDRHRTGPWVAAGTKSPKAGAAARAMAEASGGAGQVKRSVLSPHPASTGRSSVTEPRVERNAAVGEGRMDRDDDVNPYTEE